MLENFTCERRYWDVWNLQLQVTQLLFCYIKYTFGALFKDSVGFQVIKGLRSYIYTEHSNELRYSHALSYIRLSYLTIERQQYLALQLFNTRYE
jgi:hypothetical protein